MVAFSNTKSKQSADLAVKTWKMKYFQSFFESKPWLLFKIARTFNHWFGLKPELCQGKYKATRAVRPNCDPHNAETDRWINRRTVQSSRPTGQLIGRKKTEGFGASACPTIDSTDAYFKAFLTRLNTLTAENYWRCTQMGGVPSIKTICLSVSHHVTEPNAVMKAAAIILPNTLPQATALSTLLNLGTVCVQRLGFEGSRGFCVYQRRLALIGTFSL